MTAPADLREYDVRAGSTETLGRVMCSVRNHHIIVDGPVQNGFPGEEITPITLQNIQARVRSLRMWNWANSTGGLFLQTGNMSEKSVGSASLPVGARRHVTNEKPAASISARMPGSAMTRTWCPARRSCRPAVSMGLRFPDVPQDMQSM